MSQREIMRRSAARQIAGTVTASPQDTEAEGRKSGHDGETITSLLAEMGARLAKIEQQIFLLRPDAELFSKEIGPTLVATSDLCREIQDHKSEMQGYLHASQEHTARSLEMVATHFEIHRAQIKKDLAWIQQTAEECRQMARECRQLVEHFAGFYLSARETFSEAAAQAREVRAEMVRDMQAVSAGYKNLNALVQGAYARMARRVKKRLFPVICGAALVSAMIGALTGATVIERSTRRMVQDSLQASAESTQDMLRPTLEQIRTHTTGLDQIYNKSRAWDYYTRKMSTAEKEAYTLEMKRDLDLEEAKKVRRAR